MGRRVAYTRRTSFDGLEGLDGCYISWRPMTYAEKEQWIKDTSSAATDDEAIRIGVQTIVNQFVGGKLRFDAADQLEDVTADDIQYLPVDLVDRVFADITGVRYDPDPLGGTTAVSTSSETSSASDPQTTTSTTEMPSSEA